MCGSGTLLIEAALMAGCIAPGLLRPGVGHQAGGGEFGGRGGRACRISFAT